MLCIIDSIYLQKVYTIYVCINEHSNDYEPSIQQLETLCSKDHDGWVFVMLKVPTNAQKSLLKQWNAGVVVDNQDHVLM